MLHQNIPIAVNYKHFSAEKHIFFKFLKDIIQFILLDFFSDSL